MQAEQTTTDEGARLRVGNPGVLGTSRKVTPSEPGEIRSCPNVAQKLPSMGPIVHMLSSHQVFDNFRTTVWQLGKL